MEDGFFLLVCFATGPDDDLETPPKIRDWEGGNMHKPTKWHQCDQQKAIQKMKLEG
jgi:hypothetical protein